MMYDVLHLQCNETILNGCNNESLPLEYDQSVVDTCKTINEEIKDKIDECNDLEEGNTSF